MKITSTFFYITLAFLICSCRTVKDSDFIISNPLGSILPGMEGNVDLKNIYKFLSYGKVKLSGYHHGVIKVKNDPDSLKLIISDKNLLLNQQKGNSKTDSLTVYIEDPDFDIKEYRMDPDKYYTKAEFKTDERIDDLIKLFANDIKNDNVLPDSFLTGNIHMELISFKENRSKPLLFFCAWTLGTSALLGIPLTAVTTTLEIQLTIYNRSNQVLGTYNSMGKGTAWIALYWGYGKDGWRKSALVAFSRAMTSAKSAIEADKERIHTLLE